MDILSFHHLNTLKLLWTLDKMSFLGAHGCFRHGFLVYFDCGLSLRLLGWISIRASLDSLSLKRLSLLALLFLLDESPFRLFADEARDAFTRHSLHTLM